jgi:hypothetical protein
MFGDSMFWRVRQSNYDRKKVQLSGRWLECFGVPWFLDQITTGKKGTVIWPLVAMFGGFHELRLFWRGFVAMFFGGFLDKITNYDQKKKGTVVWPSVGMSTMYF